MEKITYASLGSLGEDFHHAFDTALDDTRAKLGGTHPMFIAAKPTKSNGGTFADTAPADTRLLLGRFQRGGRDDALSRLATRAVIAVIAGLVSYVSNRKRAA
jgi:hypothetical protein